MLDVRQLSHRLTDHTESQACGGSTAMSSAPSSPVSYTPPSPTSDSAHESALKAQAQAQQAAQQSLSQAAQRSPCFPALSLLYGAQVPNSYLFVGSSPFLPHLPNPDPSAFMNRNLMFGGHQSSAFTDLLMKEKCLEFTRNYHRAKTSLEVLAQQQQQQTAQQNRLGVGAGQTWRSPLELLKVEDNIAIQQTPEAVDKTPQGTPEPPRWDNLFRLFNPSLRKLSSPGQTPICPLCGITLTPQQMSEHLELEMEKFAEFYSCRRWLAPTERTQEDDLTDQHLDRICRLPFGQEKRSPLSRWETFLKVRGNRHHRLNAKISKDEENNPWDRHYAFSLAARKRKSEEITSSPLDLKEQPSAQDRRSKQLDGVQSPSEPRPSSADHPNSPKSPAAVTDSAVHCTVCEKPYDKPLVSTSCWHVLCEACWNQSLATKQCCPQCDAPASTQELRPIHL
ncbi:uncharacterized protein LOC111249989 isoform X2 [Varroa destructor]|uniref:RING-type domain-containing protein n=1 Tax=Varroa destructor TaxID=109461 RepID=A0A7M7K4H4_VARDE|nr:uncharacterized protein LOC111249989 isoform X2 [Varroa destructor]